MRKIRKRLMVTLCVMVLPLVLTLVFYNIYSMAALNRQVAQNAEGTNYIYEKAFEKDVATIESYLVGAMVGSDFVRLNYSLEPLQAHLCSENVAADFTRMLATDIDGLVALAFYSENNEVMRIRHASTTDYRETKQSAIRQAVFEEMCDENISRGWYVLPVSSDHFLVRILKYGTVYISAVIDCDYLMCPQREGEENSSYLLYTSADGTVLSDASALLDKGVELARDRGAYYVTGDPGNRYVVVYKQLACADLVQYFLSPYGSIWDSMDVLQWFLLLCSLVFIVLIPIFYLYMYRFFVVPLEGMKATMEEVAGGNLKAHADESSSVEEFRLMATTFNHMMDQIQRLKIDAYEKERRIQSTTIQYLQIQIRPHFFLNCLKNFYALAEQKKYDSIQELTLALSSYLRRVLTCDEEWIPIRSEAESVEAYLRLSRLGLSVPVSYSIHIDKELQEFGICPLSILTYVENSVKYGVQSGKTLLITVRVTKLPAEREEDSYVCITILDNGPGFPEELLMRLNSGGYQEEKGGSIGILNVQKRLMILYGNRATVLYSNSNGACVEIYLPYSS